MQRTVNLDVCDYSGRTLCSLYDSSNDISGQATNVIVHTERNGHKELRFKLPSSCEGEEKNYRLDYLISDYRIRYRCEKTRSVNGTIVDRIVETDWFLISESKVTHSNYSTDYDIQAKHISYLLNTKNLNLEFSDTEGNNTGTIRQIAETILEGTGWHLRNVPVFLEEDKFAKGEKKEKVRSFTASAKTGAFKMMCDLCELFDAKPIYRGEAEYEEDGETKIGRVVDILPMNPFSEKLEDGMTPPDLDKEKIIELYYDKNISNVTRTLNSENIVTVLYAYGSYGNMNGMASLQTANHAVITFDVLNPGAYCFIYQQTKYYFKIESRTINQKWSALDYTSRSYMYNGSELIKVATKADPDLTYILIEEANISYENNELPYIMDFTYYQKVGLLDDNMLLMLAEAQTSLPAKHIAAQEASLALSDIKSELSETASSGNGFLMLDISNSDDNTGYVVLTLNKSTYSDGVIFRSDYEEARRNYFTWNAASGLKANGEAINATGSVIYIVHQDNPTTWEKAYIKALGNGIDNYYKDNLGNKYQLHTEKHYDRKEYSASNPHDTYFPVSGTSGIIYVADKESKSYVWANNGYTQILPCSYVYGLDDIPEPNTITLWSTVSTWHSGNKVYLFSADDIAGVFGPREDQIVNNKKSIEKTLTIATEVHPMYFITDDDPLPDVEACLNSYGWCYRSYSNTFAFGKLYFIYGAAGEVGWSEVFVSNSDENPELVTPSNNYYYSLKRIMIYRSENNKYRPFKKEEGEENQIRSGFSVVINGCIKQDILTKGYCEVYNYTDTLTKLTAGNNYAFKNEYNYYWLFTPEITVSTPSKVRCYPGDDNTVWLDNDQNHIQKFEERSFRDLEFPKENELYEIGYTQEGYKDQNFTPAGDKYITYTINGIYDNTTYEFSLQNDAIVVCMDENKNVLGEFTRSPFVTPHHTTNIRIVYNSEPTGNYYLRVQNYTKVFFLQKKMYTILSCEGAGERLGMNYLMDKFISLAHDAYEVKLPALKAAQDEINQINNNLSIKLGDMYRQGYWQENNYVGGDEDKLYIDAMDNLKEISHPQPTYGINYLHLKGTEDTLGSTVQVDWPDIDIEFAAHLVDMDIDTNRWAYIDSIDDCIDLPWKTQIEINTRLSMIGQQSFTDVLAKIAEVANQTKAKQTIYERASAIGSAGQIAAEKLEGLIQANKLYILGGTSNWYTDAKGNIIFEDADGNSAMMLTGRGLMISNSRDIYGDWNWRTAISGLGINADVIAAGEFSAKHIIAGTITTDKLSSAVGSELDIGSNKALTLYATADGNRPAGGVETLHPNDTDAWIRIAAQNGDTPAYVNVVSGGEINLVSGNTDTSKSKINIESGGELNLSGATLNLNSQGKINIKSGSTIDIQSGGKFIVDSTNFKITSAGAVTITGTITATGGKIGPYTIGGTSSKYYMYAGETTSVDSNKSGIYLGYDGINFGGKFKYKTSDSSLAVKATSLLLGDKTSSYIELTNNNFSMNATASITLNADSAITVNASKKLSLTTNGTIEIGKGVKPFTIGATDGDKGHAYIYNGVTSISDAEHTGIYLGTDGIVLGKKAFTVNTSGSVHAESGDIAGWTINTSSLIGNKTGLAKTSKDADIAIWAGNATASSAAFKVTQGGSLTATSADIKGAIKATSLYIGATSSSNGTQLKLDTNGLVLSNSATASDAVKTTAGIKVDSTGIVLSSSTTDTAAAVKSAAGITVSSKGVVISSSTTDASAAIKSEAGITVDSTTGVVISSSGTSGSNSATKISTLSVSNGKIDIGCTNVGDSSSSGIYISSTKIQAKSTGVIDFSAAKSISLKAGSISMSAISDYTPVDISGKYDIITGINISTSGLDLNGSKYVHLRTNDNSYVYLDPGQVDIKGSATSQVIINSSGINMAGNQIVMNHRILSDTVFFGRDDIIILKSSDNEQTIINNMVTANKHDWVLIKPYYNALIEYNSVPATINTGLQRAIYFSQAGGSSTTFGDNASWYQYTIHGTARATNGSSTQRIKFLLSNNPMTSASSTPTVTIEGDIYLSTGSVTTVNITTQTGSGAEYNLCKENTTIYCYVWGAEQQKPAFDIQLRCQCDSTTSKVPCTVYYFP